MYRCTCICSTYDYSKTYMYLSIPQLLIGGVANVTSITNYEELFSTIVIDRDQTYLFSTEYSSTQRN